MPSNKTLKKASYKEFKSLDLPTIDKEILTFWKKKNIFQQSVDSRPDNKPFIFYEGPPSANGKPGIHHVMGRTIKDLFCRYKTLQGFQVSRKGGWDTHGLPVELSVEKTLGITKEDIGKSISIAEYNKQCRATVMQYKSQWDELTEKMGYWVDLDNPYITFDNKYIESVWWLLQQIYKKDLLYKGYTIQPYSPAAGTGLSSHELNLPGCYKNVKDTSIVAQFKIKDDGHPIASKLLSADKETFIIAWTTTPWTLPSNAALAVGEKIEYVSVKTFNAYTFKPITVVLAKDLLGKYFSEKAAVINIKDYKSGDKLIPWEVQSSFKGSELIGIHYEQLMPYVTPQQEAFKVIAGDFVSTEDGTGIVHISPTFGADDQREAQKANIPPIVVKDETGEDAPLVNKQGKFVNEVTDYAGAYVKEAYEPDGKVDADYKSVDVRIAIQLKEANRAFKVEKYEHNYPHCWRTDKPILYYPLDSWFVKTTAVKDKLVELNKQINWKPESTGTGRFGNWLENLVDWNLSRSRYWGIPLPIWRTEDKTETICIGSLEELKKAVESSIAAGNMTSQLPDDFDLHRPFVDDVILTSGKGEKMYREADLIDVWFDSGSMPYAQLHYPFENKEALKDNFPADFIAEGVDQTRGWFFTLHAIAGILFDSVAFKNVVANGLVLDKNGNKMSKRLGNAVDPFETLHNYGADATRWYMIANAPPWDNLKFDIEGIKETQRKFLGTLYNTYSFFALYANIDNFTYTESEIPNDKKSEIDRWVLSLLNSLVKEVESHFEEMDPTKAARSIQTFTIEHLSNWFVRLSRRRFWKEVEEGNSAGMQDKLSAYQTLYTCLTTISKLMSPIAPFFSDFLYQNLNNVTKKENSISVHLTSFPKIDNKLINKDLEARMQIAQDVCYLVLSLRKKENIKVRQPLEKIMIPILNEKRKAQIEAIKPLILSETNIKNIEYISDDAGIIVKKLKANFKKLGSKLGKKMKAANEILSAFNQDDIRQIEKDGFYEIDVEGEKIRIELDEVEIISQDLPGWQIANIRDLTVALDINITPTLEAEGIAREFVNKIQTLRKECGFEVTDRITLQVEKEDNFTDALNQFIDYICKEVLAEEFDFVDQINGKPNQIEINEHLLKVSINKI